MKPQTYVPGPRIPSSQPLVTVMVPTYNQEHVLLDCIESVQAQTYPNLEILVGDDASTDGTERMLAKIQDSRLRIVRHTTNQGRVGNYRTLLHQYASGEWVLNLDGDDLLVDPEAIATLVDAAVKNEQCVMAVGRVRTVHSSEELDAAMQESRLTTKGRHSERSGAEVVANYWRDDCGIKHAGVLYRRIPAMKIGFYRKSIISSDIESLLRLAVRGTVVFVPVVVAAWRIHGQNESAIVAVNPLVENLSLVDGVAEDLYPIWGDRRTRVWKRRMRNRMAYGSITRFIRRRERRQAWEFLRRVMPTSTELMVFLCRPKVFMRMVLGVR